MPCPTSEPRSTAGRRADVVVVGAGPAGTSAAWWLARGGLDVVLLEKARFPREKVCGDGLTPRAVKALDDMGVDTSPEGGWVRHRGLRVFGGGQVVEVDWPELSRWPGYGLIRARRDLDALLAEHAERVGARFVQEVTVTEPLLDDAGRVVADHRGQRDLRPLAGLADLGVHGVRAGHVDLDEHLAGARARRRRLADPQDARVAEAVENGGAHRGASPARGRTGARSRRGSRPSGSGPTTPRCRGTRRRSARGLRGS